MSLLLDALRKAQDVRDDARGTPVGERQPLPPPPPPAPTPPPKPWRSPLFALGLAVAIFLGAVSAWHSQPWRAPHKAKIDPSQLKLDPRLDLDRRALPASPRPGTPRP